MGCSSSKTAAATQLVDAPPSGPDSLGPALSVRSTASAQQQHTSRASARSASPPLQSTPILLLPPPLARGAAGDATVALALRTKRHGAIVAENASHLIDASAQHRRIVPKDPAVQAFLVAALQGNMFFGALGAGQLRLLTMW